MKKLTCKHCKISFIHHRKKQYCNILCKYKFQHQKHKKQRNKQSSDYKKKHYEKMQEYKQNWRENNRVRERLNLKKSRARIQYREYSESFLLLNEIKGLCYEKIKRPDFKRRVMANITKIKRG